MAYFAFCQYSREIEQWDAAKFAFYPLYNRSQGGNIHSIAFTADKEFVFRPTPYHVRKTKGVAGNPSTFQTDTLLYTKPTTPLGWIANVRVRNVGGVDRVYFSQKNDGDPLYRIYYLAGSTAKLYTTIDPKQLTFPNPTGGADYVGYGGDFAFGEDDTLYLSSGNMAIHLFDYPDVPIGIYKVSGAGPDAVTGPVERIFSAPGPIESLCYRSPQTLYYLHYHQIWKLTLGTMTATLESTIQSPKGSDPLGFIGFDLAYIGETGLPPYWAYYFFEALKSFFPFSFK